MSAEKPNFLSQPEVKSIYFFRNGDPFFEPRRLVLNARRVCGFEAVLREVTGGVRAPFGAVRSIYTPRGGHPVLSLEELRSGEQYVAAGREKFKKIDYSQIGSRKKRTLQLNGVLKPVPQSRVMVSARFLKPIKEPCAIFIVANGDVLNPAVRCLIPSRVIGQFERILEMITEKMGLRIVGGVHSLYTFEGTLIMDGKELENGQFYVAVGRDKFKKLQYSDLLFSKHTAVKRVNGSKAASLPPIYKYRRQNGDVLNPQSKCGSVQDKSAAAVSSSSEDQLMSMVREMSQARLRIIRKKRSMTTSLETQDNDDGEDGTAEDESRPAAVEQELSPDVQDASKSETEPAEEEEEEKKEETEVEKQEEEENKEEEQINQSGEEKQEEAEGEKEEEEEHVEENQSAENPEEPNTDGEN
ncbi:doublecortin domain-containing protein 2-like [Danio aesculapii]|uniref:doublecortin domain-containing protein 2-like n=1 Tax=Danio aesculapii TaxID=1142201 RepID=UPI0024C09B2E|nr:doublecortin domain-containing protein 2-like [Danio aesculapii]